MAISPSLIHSPSDLLMPSVAGPNVKDSAAPYDAAQGELAHTSASAAAASMMTPPSVSDFASGGPGSTADVFTQAPSFLVSLFSFSADCHQARISPHAR